MDNQVIGFIGGGNMANSLIGGLVNNGFPADKIIVSDLDEKKLAFLKAQFGVQTSQDNAALVSQVDILVLAVKPQHMKAVTVPLQQVVQLKKPAVVSIAAGIREADLDKWLGGEVPIIRCMPNTPALVKTGATGLHANAFVSEQQKDQTESLLRAVGVTVWLTEEQELDTVTALSGSGPAYFFLMMEALEKAAVDAGLEQKTARLLTQETALGAAKMALASNESTATLRQRVTSPGGTTEAAIAVMEKMNLREIMEQAIAAAKQRSISLSDELGG
jgi:pyrroline-5-carboxylate reductase